MPSTSQEPESPVAGSPVSDTPAITRHGKTRPWFLVGGLAFILLAAAFWHPLQRQTLAFFLLHSDAPSEETLSIAAEQASNPTALLTRLWQTERIPHRQFVISYLGRIATTKTGVFHALEPLLIEATADPDVETRQLAFAALGRAKYPELRKLTLQQLSDADPAVRINGLQSLRGIATSNDVPLAVHLLDDPEPRVVVAAAMLLRHVTGQDFGISSSLALPQFTCVGTNPPPAPEVVAIKAGVMRWQEWWTAHKGEFSDAGTTLDDPAGEVRIAAEDFILEDVAGKRVHVSQFHGKELLLAFWSVGAPASLDDVAALKALQRRNPERLVVLGICIPPAPSCADEHEHGHDHAHHHDASHAATLGPEQMRAQARERSDQLGLNFPMLVDTKGAIGRRFKAEDLPTYVLIDPEGKVFRRFVGFRTEQDLEAMAHQVLVGKPVAGL